MTRTIYTQVAPDISAQEAADKYTGFSDRVSKDELEEALGYFEYAVAAYYVVVSLMHLLRKGLGKKHEPI